MPVCLVLNHTVRRKWPPPPPRGKYQRKYLRSNGGEIFSLSNTKSYLFPKVHSFPPTQRPCNTLSLGLSAPKHHKATDRSQAEFHTTTVGKRITHLKNRNSNKSNCRGNHETQYLYCFVIKFYNLIKKSLRPDKIRTCPPNFSFLQWLCLPHPLFPQSPASSQINCFSPSLFSPYWLDFEVQLHVNINLPLKTTKSCSLST